MRSEQSLVSVIVPVYNRENYLEECVASVLHQTYQNVEILLIDDGSTDDSLALCHKLGQQDNRIRVLESGHLGVSDARNLGLDAVQGEYVFFLDSDDVIHPKLLEALVRAMENTGAGIARGELFVVPQQKWEQVETVMARPCAEVNVKHLSGEDALQTLLYGKSSLNSIGGIMMRTASIEGTRFREELFVGEDWFFVYENLVKGTDVALLDVKWYFYHQHSSNAIKDCSFDAFYSRFKRRELVWKMEESFGRKQNVKHQKRDAMGVFFRHVRLKHVAEKDRKRMCGTIKAYKKDLLPALTLSAKMYCLLAAYAPGFYSPAIYNAVAKCKKMLLKKRA